MAEDVAERDLRDRPVGELMKELAAQTSTLVRQEIELAKVEMTEKGKAAAVAGGMFGAATLVGLLALGALTLCFIAALATALEGWLAALIVAVVYALGAAALAFQGRDRLRRAVPPVPIQTVETLKEDVEWAKTRQSSARR